MLGCLKGSENPPRMNGESKRRQSFERKMPERPDWFAFCIVTYFQLGPNRNACSSSRMHIHATSSRHANAAGRPRAWSGLQYIHILCVQATRVCAQSLSLGRVWLREPRKVCVIHVHAIGSYIHVPYSRGHPRILHCSGLHSTIGENQSCPCPF